MMTMTSKDTNEHALFWDVAQPLLASGTATEGTIMSSTCLRVGSEFLAMPHHKEYGLVVKLPKQRVAELIEQGHGRPFSPAGKVFREWVHIPEPDEEHWLALLHEGVEFVS